MGYTSDISSAMKQACDIILEEDESHGVAGVRDAQAAANEVSNALRSAILKGKALAPEQVRAVAAKAFEAREPPFKA